MSTELIQDREVRKKILDRFVSGGTVRIELPENMAFRLMAQAMKTTSDPVLQPEWEKTFKPELNQNLAGVRDTIIRSAQKRATMGSKTVISDAELQPLCRAAAEAYVGGFQLQCPQHVRLHHQQRYDRGQRV